MVSVLKAMLQSCSNEFIQYVFDTIKNFEDPSFFYDIYEIIFILDKAGRLDFDLWLDDIKEIGSRYHSLTFTYKVPTRTLNP